jgi:hypothetical protein
VHEAGDQCRLFHDDRVPGVGNHDDLGGRNGPRQVPVQLRRHELVLLAVHNEHRACKLPDLVRELGVPGNVEQPDQPTKEVCGELLELLKTLLNQRPVVS